jgi:hypothetical protein
MALIINTPIGTDRGLATNAYVRIQEYRILKTGECIFEIHIYKSKADAILADSDVATYATSNHLTCVSLEIGKELRVDLRREIVKTVTVQTEVPKTVQRLRTVGNKTYNVTENIMDAELSTYETTLKVPNWNQVENHNIFEFGYAKLRDRLCDLYGEENISDDHTIAAGDGPFATELAVDIAARKAGHIDSVPPQS